jgi:cytoskeletal protein RodZ
LENLGKYFLDLRLKRDLSYKRIWEDIRIREEQVKSLEANRIFELGPYGVVKALVYNYARYLEADLDAVMHEFSVMMPDTTRSKFTPNKTVKEKKIMLSTNFLWMVGIGIIVIVLGSILFNAYSRGWLVTPGFLTAAKPDTVITEQPEPREDDKPDSLRQRMRILSESVAAQNAVKNAASATQSSLADTTDYMGNLLGDSPVNVPLH